MAKKKVRIMEGDIFILPLKNGKYAFGGNFFGVIPYEGRYDAQALGIFEFSKNGNIIVLPQSNFKAHNKEIRDIKWIKTINNKLVLSVAQNNDKLLFFNSN